MPIYLKDVRKEVKKTEREVGAAQMQKAFGWSKLRNLQLMLVDQAYWTVPEETWDLILRYSKVDKIKYRPDRQDCDDFAHILNGEVCRKLQLNTVGEVLDFSGGHAYCCIVIDRNPALEIVGVEPQSDRMRVAASGHKMYSARHGLVTF